MRKVKVALLGATGSIGKSTLEILRKYRDRFELIAFSVHNNLEGFQRIVEEFSPKIGVITGAAELISPPIRTLYGREALIEVASLREVDIIVVATAGNMGVYPTIFGLKSGKRVALANKETLVSFGQIVIDEYKKSRGELIPVDSEHSALFQLTEKYGDQMEELILTASGGPFRNTSREEMEKVSIDDVLKHPVWRMGKKITVDSATLMNKGLEVIEAHWLFNLSPDRIKVLIHPQSILHGLVKMKDGAYLAHMSYPDMKIPIQYALTYPERWQCDFVSLDLSSLRPLEFYGPDTNRFPLLKLAYEALSFGGIMPCVMNAANDVAVESFLKGEIRFLDIEKVVFATFDSFVKESVPGKLSLEALERFDSEARAKATETVTRIKN
ncbi:MAG: 1-deoxy-D-xylulose-5-phosphate reductoisomerase [Candidatus Hydrothermia bacterium]